MASIKVAVRVRPFNQREKNMDAKCIIHMENNRTSIISSKDGTCVENDEAGKDNVKDFFFDYCYWSCDESSSNYSGQDVVYSNLGTGVVTAADEGYNACIFAYGQTGSGKTHTMMGEAGNEGLIPRICENLFSQMQEKEDEGVSFRTEVSYLEIYNEKVRDLLRTHQQPKAGQALHGLKVREHPKDGPYVQGLTKHLVSDYHAIETIMKQGNERRTTASTNMNDTSSRSHAIFTIRYTQAKFLHDMPSETTSKINLVDLAGSERANSTGATGLRLKEGGNINKSLVTLGSVISSLAEASTKKSTLFIPYRDSILTWLLKDSLGGNSKTIMIAAISPADVNYSETLSTLRYANRAKNIINKPTVNEDTNVKLIRDLRAEIDKLKSIIGQEVLSDADKVAARKLYENEERLGALTDKWKDRWKETQKIMQDRALAFQHRLDAGIRMESELPHLVALEDDLLSTGILLYHLKEGKTFVGTENSKTKPDIVVSGPGIQDEQCIIENNDGFVVLDPFPKALCSVNGEIINKRTRLQQGDVVILGKTAVFRFNHPKEAEELREKRKSVGPGFSNLSLSAKYHSETDLLKKMMSVERQKREEDLTKQLEESRMLLEKQKQEEERRMEEARNEFARQIREESRRLQETRGELQGRLRARFQSALSPAEIRKHLSELECQHNDAEIKRKQREKELVDSINEKISLMEHQQNCLNDLLEKCKVVKEENKKYIEQEVKNFHILRSKETLILNNEIRAFIDTNPLDENKISELKEIWDAESLKLMQQENTCDFLNNEIKECIFALEKKGNLDDEDKVSLEDTKNQLLSKIRVEQATLEELSQSKAKVLRKYENSFLNRYQFLIWEREMLNDKTLRKKDIAETDLAVLKNVLAEAQSNLDDVKTKFILVEAEENKKMASERYRVDQMKKTSIKQTIEDQRAFNEKVQQYRALLKKGQDRIDLKNAEIESMRKELTIAVQVKNDNAKVKADLQEKINSMIEDLHELEKNHVIIKNEEEKVIKSMLKELNNKKMENEKDAKMSEKVLSELQNISHEKILSFKKQVDISENQVHNCDADILKCYEKLNEINKYNDESNAKLDAELLYVAYLVEKEIQGKEEFQDILNSINTAKLKLEQANKSYAESIENIQNKTEVLWKPLVESRDQVQVVLEDLSCAKNVAEMTLAELKEQFSVERKIELEEIESLREKLRESSVELEHGSEHNSEPLGNHLNSSLISNGTDFNIEEILVKQKQQIEDEMYEKIITMEKVMQQELDELKKREMQLLACLQKDREKLLSEKSSLEKNKNSTEEHFNEEHFNQVTQLLKVKDDELKATRDNATKEIERLHNELANANNEIIILQEKLEKYYSTSSLTSPDYEEDELSDTEVSQLLIRVNESEGFDEEDELIARLRNSPPSPPPTPINRFLQSVNIYKRNQINAAIPKFILRGIGKGSYHVFEVKLRVGDNNWTVYRRYRQFRDLHRQTIRNHPIVGNLEFPSRRYFGNLSEDFVRVRRAQLEAYLIAFLAILSNDSTCRIYAITRRTLTKQDLAIFHPFFKEGIYERNKSQ